MNPKTSLFITHSFPSIGSANSLCDEKLIRFRGKTEKIFVLCYRFPNQTKHEIDGNIEVFRVWKDEFWAIERLARSSSGGRFCQKAARLICRMRQMLYLPFFPNYEKVAIAVLSKKAAKIIREKNVGNLFADFNGTDTLLGGYKAAKQRGINFYPLFWDALSLGVKSRYVTPSFNDRRKKKLEQRIIVGSKASFFLCQAKSKMLPDYSDRPNLVKKMIFFSLPLFEPIKGEISKTPQQGKNEITFICGGSLLGRDYIPFFSAISRLFQSGIKVLLYPTTDSQEEIKNIRKFPFVEIRQVLSSAEFTKQCMQSDILVAAGVKNPYLPTGKLYQFFATGKPVIYLCRNQADPSIIEIKRYPLSYVYYDDTALNDAEALMSFVQNSKKVHLTEKELDGLFPENRPETFWKLINDLDN